MISRKILIMPTTQLDGPSAFMHRNTSCSIPLHECRGYER
jgi:hypothetical protein